MNNFCVVQLIPQPLRHPDLFICPMLAYLDCAENRPLSKCSMLQILILFVELIFGFQCFDAVGLATGRASGL